jgi:hypothetical protein
VPAGDAAAGHVAGAEGEVGAVAGERDQAREVGGVVRAVGVHLADELGVVRERVGEAGDVGGAEAELARAVEHLGAELLGERAGAVGAGVVDDEDVGAPRRRAPRGRRRSRRAGPPPRRRWEG